MHCSAPNKKVFVGLSEGSIIRILEGSTILPSGPASRNWTNISGLDECFLTFRVALGVGSNRSEYSSSRLTKLVMVDDEETCEKQRKRILRFLSVGLRLEKDEACSLTYIVPNGESF